MRPDVSNNTVALLRSAGVVVRLGPVQNPGLEFVDSVENGHPAFLDRLNAQPEIRAEFGVGFAGKSRSKKPLFSGTQPEDWCLITIHCRCDRVRRSEYAFPRHNGQGAFGLSKLRHDPVRSRRAKI